MPDTGNKAPEPLTIQYSTAPCGHALFLDLYLPSRDISNEHHNISQTSIPDLDIGSATSIPTVVYFHGGNLLYGSRDHIPREFLHDILDQNWAFISASYRKLFPCTADDIRSDVHSLFSFLSSGTINNHITPQRPFKISQTTFFVAGYSAGAYCARLACLMHPGTRPKAAFFLAGQGGEWISPQYLCPKAMEARMRLESHSKWLYFDGRVAKSAEARAKLRGELEVRSELGNFWFDEREDREKVKKEIRETNERMVIATVLYQIGRKLDYLTGYEGLSQTLLQEHFTPKAGYAVSQDDIRNSIPKELHHLFPEIMLQDRAVARRHPPVVLIHGTGDKTVRPEESARTAEQLREVGVKVELVLAERWGHGYTPSVWENWGKEKVVSFFREAIEAGGVNAQD